MTRINTIAPALLPTPWLMAEYRELPRIINHVASLPASLDCSITNYRMGAGHVKFFYNKLHWLHQRHREIRLALQERFPNTHFSIDTTEAYLECRGHSPDLCGPLSWGPGELDHAACLARLFERWKGSRAEWETFFNTVMRHHNLSCYKFVSAYFRIRDKQE